MFRKKTLFYVLFPKDAIAAKSESSWLIFLQRMQVSATFGKWQMHPECREQPNKQPLLDFQLEIKI